MCALVLLGAEALFFIDFFMVFMLVFLSHGMDIPAYQPTQIHKKLKMSELNNRNHYKKAILNYIIHNKIKVLLNNLQ